MFRNGNLISPSTVCAVFWFWSGSSGWRGKGTTITFTTLTDLTAWSSSSSSLHNKNAIVQIKSRVDLIAIEAVPGNPHQTYTTTTSTANILDKHASQVSHKYTVCACRRSRALRAIQPAPCPSISHIGNGTIIAVSEWSDQKWRSPLS